MKSDHCCATQHRHDGLEIPRPSNLGTRMEPFSSAISSLVCTLSTADRASWFLIFTLTPLPTGTTLCLSNKNIVSKLRCLGIKGNLLCSPPPPQQSYFAALTYSRNTHDCQLQPHINHMLEERRACERQRQVTLALEQKRCMHVTQAAICTLRKSRFPCKMKHSRRQIQQ